MCTCNPWLALPMTAAASYGEVTMGATRQCTMGIGNMSRRMSRGRIVRASREPMQSPCRGSTGECLSFLGEGGLAETGMAHVREVCLSGR
ncbi:hypothetical protein LZ30DRAFT_386059 [Colletotrichum cereale]|nr:hypothetical protein LZ30DRAFT_386059 [Colletotrichum cereale]